MISLSTLSVMLLAVWFLDAWDRAGHAVWQSELARQHAEAEASRVAAEHAAAEALRLAPLRDLPGWHPDAWAALWRDPSTRCTLLPEVVWWQVSEAAEGEVVMG